MVIFFYLSSRNNLEHRPFRVVSSLEADILIHDCTILPMNGKQTIIEHGLIAIKDDKILYMGKKSHAPKMKAEKLVDGHGKVAIPGLVNCHTHLPMTLFRGIAEDQDLGKWLGETIWPLEARLKPADVYNGALLGCLELIKNGVTCFADMYFYEDMVAKAVEEAGLRAVLAPGILEVGDLRRGEEMLEEGVRLVRELHGSAGGRISVRLGPHALYSCSPNLLRRIRDEASKFGVGIHIHLSESREMGSLVEERYGLSEVELLEGIGFLGGDVLAAHCIHLSDREMRIMAKHDVKVSYNPISNMKIASGIPKINDLMKLGVTVGIGTNGPASNNNLDILEEMKVAALLQKAFYTNPKVLPVRTILRMATIDGARALGLDKSIGSLEVGKKADLILIDFRKPHLTPVHDPYANIVYSARGSDVETVIVNGRVLMEERTVTTLDEEEVIRRAQQTALDLLT